MGGQESPGKVKGLQERSEETSGEWVVQGRSEGVMGGQERSGEDRRGQHRSE